MNTAHVNPKTVQEMLRHSKVQTTLDLYGQGDNDNKISAQDEFSVDRLWITIVR